MIRPVTCLCLLASLGSGLYLYSEKHRTALLDRDIGRLIHATEAAHARTGMLRAEWALLNEPGRLQDMSGRYLALHPMAPTQFIQLSDLATHLPAPDTTVVADDDAPDATAASTAPVVAVAAATPSPIEQAAFPSHHPMQPPLKTDANSHAVKLLAHAEPHHAPHHVALADRQDTPLHDGLRPMGTPLPLAAPQPVGARVYSAMARPMGRPLPTRLVSAVPSFAPAVTSSLGGAGSLPPPVPYGR